MIQQEMFDSCKRKDCNNPKRGTQFCVEHECAFEGCNAGPKKDQALCGPHYDMAEREYVKMAEEAQRQDELKAAGGVDIANAFEEKAQMHKNAMELKDLPTHNEKGKKIYYISASGHRPNKIGGYEFNFKGGVNPEFNQALRDEIYTAILEAVQRAVVKFGDDYEIRLISGMAQGVDQLFVRVAMELKLKYYCFVPCLRHETKWTSRDQSQYNIMLSLSEGVIYITKATYNYKCMQLRNEAMVDKSNATIFVWDGTEGGTFNCLKYAHRVGQPKVMIFVNDKGVVTSDKAIDAYRTHMKDMLNG